MAKKKIKPVEKASEPLLRPIAETPKGEAVQTPSAPEAPKPLTRNEKYAVIAFGILLMLVMTVQTGKMTMLLFVLTLLSLICKFGRKAVVPTVAALGFAAYGVVFGAAAAWSPFEAWSIGEFYKFVTAFMMVVILLTHFEKKHVPALLWVFPSVSAFVGFLSVDMDASGFFFYPVHRLLALAGVNYTHLVGKSQVRLTGIYNNANVMACLVGCAALLSLYLLRSRRSRKEKWIAAFLLGVNAMVFFMSYSRGCMIAFAVACLAWLIAEGKGSRLSLFFSMLSCVIPTVLLAVPSIRLLSQNSFIPDLTVLICGFLIFLLDSRLMSRLAAWLNCHIKVAYAALGAVVVAGITACVLVFSLIGPISISGGQAFRVQQMSAGDYVLSGDWDPLDQVSVQWHKRVGNYMTPWETLYEGDGTQEVSFTVPEDGFVQLTLSGPDGTQIRRLDLSDGSSFKLNYQLIPDFIETRMQDSLVTGESFSLRLQYDIDTLKIWLTSPIFGRGISSTEELYTMVQPFYYEVKYAHNFVLQILADTGLVGLVCFLVYLGGAVWVTIAALRKQRDELPAVFLSIFTLVIVHSLMELNFNVRSFQCFTYSLLMLPALLYAQPIFGRGSNAQEKCNLWASRLLLVFFALYVLIFGTLIELHRWSNRDAETYETTSFEDFVDRMHLYVQLDVFAREESMTEAIPVILQNDTTGKYAERLYGYIDKLQRMGTYSSLTTVADQYYYALRRWDEVFALTQKGLLHEASNSEAWNLEFAYFRDTLLPAMVADDAFEDFLSGMDGMLAQFDATNERLLDDLQVEEDNAAFVELVRSAISGSADARAELLELAEAGT